MPTNPNHQPNGHPRFTVDGSAQLELQLSRTCEMVGEEVTKRVRAKRLQGVLLGGGYGRGEGGVLKIQEREEPYNDLEFYVLMRGNPRLNERRCGSELDCNLQGELGHAGKAPFALLGRRRFPRHQAVTDCQNGERRNAELGRQGV